MDGRTFLGCAPELTTSSACDHHSIVVNDTTLKVIGDSCNRRSLIVAETLLSSNTCEDIIQFCCKEHPIVTISEKIKQPLLSEMSYVFQSKTLSEHLTNVLKPKLLEQITDFTPLGFDTSEGQWNLQGLDDTFEVLKLQYINDTHREKRNIYPQRIINRHQRSLFSVIVFLNNNFEGGEISVHLRKSSSGVIDSKEMFKIDENCDLHSLSPETGKALLLSHDLVSKFKCTNTDQQWILKTNVMVERNDFDFYHVPITDQENDKLSLYLEYFKKGQAAEAKGLLEEANTSYELGLSIAYSSPTISKEVQDEKISQENSTVDFPELVWFTLFNNLSGKDIENVIKAFPYLYSTQKAYYFYKFRLSSSFSNENYVIPKLVSISGTIREMIFLDSFFFEENIESCVRVAVASSSNFNHTVKDNLVVYNTETQETVPISMYNYLQAVFANQPLHGAVFSLPTPVQIDSDINDQLADSVDRAYMAIRHRLPFMGESLSKQMKVDVTYDQIDDKTLAYLIKDKNKSIDYDEFMKNLERDPSFDYSRLSSEESQDGADTAGSPRNSSNDVKDQAKDDNTIVSSTKDERKVSDDSDDSDDSHEYDSEDSIAECSPEKLEEIETYLMNMITKKMDENNFEINYDLVTTGYFGNVDRVACFPLALKDIFRYLKWNSYIREFCYSSDFIRNRKWLMDHLVYHNSFLFYLTRAPVFQDLYRDGKFHRPDRYTTSQLYTKLLLENCQEYAGMSVTAVSEINEPVKVPGSSICVCQCVFVPEYGGYDRFGEFAASKTHYLNNMLFDFDSHRMEVSKYTHKDSTITSLQKESNEIVMVADDDVEGKCLFASALLGPFIDLKFKDLENTFHYVVYINPIVPPKEKVTKKFPYYPFNQSFNPYECTCYGPDFTVKSCYIVEDFISVDHVHVLGGKNVDSNEMKVWTVLGGIHSG